LAWHRSRAQQRSTTKHDCNQGIFHRTYPLARPLAREGASDPFILHRVATTGIFLWTVEEPIHIVLP
jgi:hypothetical protein